MNDFESNSAQQTMNRYFPVDVQEYFYASLKPGTFHIWHGTGSNGKSVLSKIVSKALQFTYNLNTYFTSETLFLEGRNNKAKILIVDDYDSAHPIPVNRAKELLANGYIVILLTNTLPLFQGDATSLFDATHVIPFKNRYPTTDTDYIPENLLCRYIADKIHYYNEFSVNAPNAVKHAFHQLKLLNGTAEQAIAQSAREAAKGLTNLKNAVEKTVAAPVPAPPTLCVEYTDDDAPVPHASEKQTSYASIRIDIIRIDMYTNNSAAASLTIAVDETCDGYIATYNEESYQTVLYVAEDRIYDYVRMFFGAIDASEERHSLYKFMAPGFPTITVSAAKVQKYVSENFIQQLEFLAENWPTA
jgi:hypothetical protein